MEIVIRPEMSGSSNSTTAQPLTESCQSLCMAYLRTLLIEHSESVNFLTLSLLSSFTLIQRHKCTIHIFCNCNCPLRVRARTLTCLHTFCCCLLAARVLDHSIASLFQVLLFMQQCDYHFILADMHVYGCSVSINAHNIHRRAHSSPY